jgi:predicted transcriptional regulator
MEVKLSPELQAKLDNIAAQQGRDAASLVHEAVERLMVTTSGSSARCKKAWRRSIAAKRSSMTKLPPEWKSSSPRNNAAANAS